MYYVPLALASLCFVACSTNVSTKEAPETPGPLYDQIVALDSEVFSSFNTCVDPGQLRKHADYFSETVEFYHDNGGVTWNRRDMLANTEKYVCGKFKRVLVPSTIRVYPIKDFGALEQGVHRFCRFKTGDCDGAAEFVILWRLENNQWTITRVLSYGHRPST